MARDAGEEGALVAALTFPATVVFFRRGRRVLLLAARERTATRIVNSLL